MSLALVRCQVKKLLFKEHFLSKSAVYIAGAFSKQGLN